MHTIKILAISFLLFGVCLLVGRLLNGSRGIAFGALIFLPLSLIVAGINMYFGVKHEGYSPAQELQFFLIVLLIPAIPAVLTWWKVHQ